MPARSVLARCLVWTLIAAACATHAGIAQRTSTLIRGASVIDGEGTPGRDVDVRIDGDQIVAMGRLTPEPGDTVIDARGLVLAPGFIDPHSHHDRGLARSREALAVVSQGVTTIVVGQDGSGEDLEALFAGLDAEPAAVNVASYAGHGSLRRAVLGDDFRRAATVAEIERMRDLLRAAMKAGALGLSTGLEYDPGIYATPEEVLALAEEAEDAGGRYISHLRSEDRDLWTALDEIIAIGRRTGMPVQVSHIKLAMSDLWGQAERMIRMLDAARRSGVDITADIYPYTWWQSNLGVFYPKRNFTDAKETEFILTHLTPAEDIRFSNGPAGYPEYAGKSLAEIAALRGTSPVQTMLDLLAGPDGPRASIVARGMSEADVEMLLRWPFASICSDGASTGLHPRGFGSFPRVLGTYVRERKLLPLEDAVRKMTSLTARSLGLRDRGSIRTGAFADLVLFDPGTIAARATFESPQATAIGIRRVWVNGQIVFEEDAPTGRHPGRALRR